MKDWQICMVFVQLTVNRSLCVFCASLLQQVIGLRRDSRQRGLQEEGGKLSVVSFLWDFHRGIRDLPQGFKQPIKDLDVWLCHKSVAMKESVCAAYLLRVIKLWRILIWGGAGWNFIVSSYTCCSSTAQVDWIELDVRKCNLLHSRYSMHPACDWFDHQPTHSVNQPPQTADFEY